MKIIPYNKQHITKSDIDNVKQSLISEMITTGPKVALFEKNLSKFFNSKFSLVCNSGTSALYLAFLSINLKDGDVVIMPIINFIAAYNMCKKLKAKIFFADVNPNTGQMEYSDVLNCIRKNLILQNLKDKCGVLPVTSLVHSYDKI